MVKRVQATNHSGGQSKVAAVAKELTVTSQYKAGRERSVGGSGFINASAKAKKKTQDVKKPELGKKRKGKDSDSEPSYHSGDSYNQSDSEEEELERFNKR